MIDRRTSHYHTSRIVARDAYRVGLVSLFIACMVPLFQTTQLARPIIGEIQVYASAPKPAVQTILQPPKLSIEDKIRATFPEDPDRAVAIAKCESGMRANAFNGKNKNGSWDAGVMQINSVHKYSKEYLFDVDNNLKVARKLYDRQGWTPWVCYWKNK